MSGKFSVAVVGATGLVGETMVSILEQRDFPVDELFVLASSRSAGKKIRFRNRQCTVEDLANFDFRRAQIGLFSAGGSVSREFAPRAAEAGCIVIDNTSHFRYEDDIPLVVPEVNPEALKGVGNRNIIANPNCSTIQLVVACKPIYDEAGIDRINVATYQAVSGAGRSSVERLARQTAMLMNGKSLEGDDAGGQIAFNALPHIDAFQDNGYTREEMKMVWETRKILGDEEIRVNATAVRIPVFYGHSEAVNLETSRPLEPARARELLAQAPGIEVMDGHSPGAYPTPAVEASQTDPVYVGRIRRDISHERGLNLWVVADNVRKGAALNSVQIAEILVKEYL